MQTYSLNDIKKNIKEKEGQNINLRAFCGRRGKLICQGIVDGVYPDVFTVKVLKDGYERKYCYTYAEVLTNNVEISSLV